MGTMFKGDGLQAVGTATRWCRCPRFGMAHRPDQCGAAQMAPRDDGLNIFRGLLIALPAALIFWAIVTFPIWRRFLPHA